MVRGPRGKRGEVGPPGRDANQIPEFEQQKERLNKEAKIEVLKPEAFTGKDRNQWETFLSQLRRYFRAKPTIYELDQERINLAVSYLTEAAATHFDNLVDRQENGTFVPALETWADFVAEFSKTFGIFDIARDAQT